MGQHQDALRQPVVEATRGMPPVVRKPTVRPEPAANVASQQASREEDLNLAVETNQTRELEKRELHAEPDTVAEFQSPQAHQVAIKNPVVKATQAIPAPHQQQRRQHEIAAVPTSERAAPLVAEKPRQRASVPSEKPSTNPTKAIAAVPQASPPENNFAQRHVPRQKVAPQVAPRPRPTQRVARQPSGGGNRGRAASRSAGQETMPPFIAQKVAQHYRYGQDLAARGALHSARSEYMRALDVVAHALDARYNTKRHREALREGLTALREADDLIPHVDQGDAGWWRSVAKHSTPILKSADTHDIHPFAAMQKYCEFAGERLITAVGHEPSASMALYGMARLELRMNSPSAGQSTLAGPRAIVLHQAALSANTNNFEAANELGVLFARYGQLEQARVSFLHSVRISPQPETWQNLAKVSHLLGDYETANAAKHQQLWLVKHRATLPQGAHATGGQKPMSVKLVDPITFDNIPSVDHAIGPATPRNLGNGQPSMSRSQIDVERPPEKKRSIARVFKTLK